MKFRIAERLRPSRLLIMLGGTLFLLVGGCPIDSDKLTTDVVQAALESVTSSLVEALSTYLAGN